MLLELNKIWFSIFFFKGLLVLPLATMPNDIARYLIKYSQEEWDGKKEEFRGIKAQRERQKVEENS